MDWNVEIYKAHKDRVQEQQKTWEQKELLGENIYLDFCVWCNGYADEKAKTNPNAFAKYLRENKVKITDRQRENIAINHFGYVYDVDKQKWVKG